MPAADPHGFPLAQHFIASPPEARWSCKNIPFAVDTMSSILIISSQ